MPTKQINILKPDIFNRFACKGGDCRHDCCQGWNINISRAEYNKYRHMRKAPPELQEQLKTMLKRTANPHNDFEYARVILRESDNHCPLFAEDGLCDLQRHCGAGALSKTCKIFPRMYFTIDQTYCTACLDTGCERVVELLLEEAEQGLQFITEPLPTEKFSGGAYQTGILSEWCVDIRNLCILILKNRSHTLDDRMILLGLAMRELDEIQQAEQPDRVPAWFMKYQNLSQETDLADAFQTLTGNRSACLMNNYQSLSRLLPGRTRCLKEILSNLQFSVDSARQVSVNEKVSVKATISYHPEIYDQLEPAVREKFPQLENLWENFMVLTMFRWMFPFKVKDAVWKSYTELCTIYSLMKFVSIGINPTCMTDIVDALSDLSRGTLNSPNLDPYSYGALEENGSDSLAHMLILIRG